MKPDAFIEAARTWIGTPFIHQGRARGAGVDCLGLVYETARTLGLIDEPWRPYSREPAAGMLEETLRACPALKEVYSIKPGDLLVFRFARDLQHIGIYTGRNIIHAYEPRGECVEHGYCKKWENRHVLSFRFLAFDEQ